MPALVTPPHVSPQQREALEREGWLFVPQLLAPGALEELLRAAAQLQRASKTLTQDTTVLGVLYEVQSQSGRKGEPAVFPGALRKVTAPSKQHAVFSRLRGDPGLRETLVRLGLARPQCIVDQVNYKLPRVGGGFPFHQDARFLIGRTQGRIEANGGLNLVIALDEADAENGGFEVLGRTHQGPLKDFSYDAAQMNEGVFDESHRTLTPMQPGDALFFHPHLAHGSGRNLSERPRRLVTLWCVGEGPPAHALKSAE